MTDFEEFQKKLLNKLGYDIVPFNDDVVPLFAYLEDDKFIFLNKYAERSSRQSDIIKGNVLVGVDNDGYHLCQSQSKQGEQILHHPLYWRYYILWGNDEYTEIPCLCELVTNRKDTFELVETDSYLAIKYYKDRMSKEGRLQEKPLFDTIVSREKGIYHIGVFTYFYKDMIVVYDKNESVIVYDKELNVLFESGGDFTIVEKESKCYLIFPSFSTVYELTERKEIKLSEDDDDDWHSVKAYKDVFVLYTQHRCPVDKSSYYDDYSDWDYDDKNSPIENTEGCIYDYNFKFLRRFNVLGEIADIEEVGVTLAMKIITSTYNEDDTEWYFNVRGSNTTIYDDEANEEISMPDFAFIEMGFGDRYIFVSKGTPSKICNHNGDKKHKCKNIKYRLGVCKRDLLKQTYTILVDCYYDKIIPMPIKADKNAYYVGIVGPNKKCDFYVKDILLYQGLPFNNGNSIRVLKSGYFINVTDSKGTNRIIRKGKVVFSTKYEVANAYVQKDIDADGFDVIGDTYLIVVTKDNLYGIYSSTGKMLLPIEYSTIDIDEYFNVVLGKKDLDIDQYVDELKEVYLRSRRNDEYMQIGEYSKEYDVINYGVAKVYENEVQIDRSYYWNNEFVYLGEEDDDCGYINVPSNWDDYSYDDSLYDALGGEMDAKWNID